MLSQEFLDELGYILPLSTISDLISKKDIIMKAEDSIEFRARSAQYPKLEECLYIYLCQKLEKKCFNQ